MLARKSSLGWRRPGDSPHESKAGREPRQTQRILNKGLGLQLEDQGPSPHAVGVTSSHSRPRFQHLKNGFTVTSEGAWHRADAPQVLREPDSFAKQCVCVGAHSVTIKVTFDSEGCLFTLLIVSFVVQKLLSFIRSHLFIFAFIFNILGGGS